jgi:YfiR/HmsC-like
MTRPLAVSAALQAAVRPLLRPLAVLSLLAFALPALADDLPEYRVKAAILFNFVLFTEWPTEVGGVLNLCISGTDPFGKEIDVLQGKAVGSRTIDVQRRPAGDSLKGCQIVFIAPSAIGALPQMLEGVRGRPVLTVADTTGAARLGVALNLTENRNRVSFEVNLQAARAGGLNLSSKLLRLATEVIQ